MARRRIAPRKRVTQNERVVNTETIDLTIPKKRKSHEIIIDITGIDIREIEEKITRLETEKKDYLKVCEQYHSDEIESIASTSTTSHGTPDRVINETEFKNKVKIEYLKQTEEQEQKSRTFTSEFDPEKTLEPNPDQNSGLTPKIENLNFQETKPEIQKLFVSKQLKIMKDISTNGLQNSNYTLSEKISAVTYTLEKFHKSKKK
jgi:hypothetical protein